MQPPLYAAGRNMQISVVVVAACLVVLQATSDFMGRGGWTFLMAMATPEAASWQSAMSLIHAVNRPMFLPPVNSWFITYKKTDDNTTSSSSSSTTTTTTMVSDESLIYCLQSTYMRAGYCLQHAHTPHSAEQAMQAWNPHVMLLALACLHLHITLGTYAPLYTAPLLLALVIVAAVIEGLRDSAFMQYPTIVTLVLVTLAGAWFSFMLSFHADDRRWRMAAHLQLVSVPLAVLGISVAGGRLWSDALSYFVLFSAAVNCLWMQGTLRGTLPLGLCRAFTIGLTVVPLRISNDGFGVYDTWRYVVAYVACAGLAPLVLLSLFPSVSIPPAADETGSSSIGREDDEDAHDSSLIYCVNPHNAARAGVKSYYFHDYYYQRFVTMQAAQISSSSWITWPLSLFADAADSQTALMDPYRYHHLLLQLCTCGALLGMAANLSFAFDNGPIVVASSR